MATTSKLGPVLKGRFLIKYNNRARNSTHACGGQITQEHAEEIVQYTRYRQTGSDITKWS